MLTLYRYIKILIILLLYIYIYIYISSSKSCDEHNSYKLQLSPQMISHITVHGILLWVSMGFLMPIGILIIRLSGREQSESTRAKVFFYLHVILQASTFLLVNICSCSVNNYVVYSGCTPTNLQYYTYINIIL